MQLRSSSLNHSSGAVVVAEWLRRWTGNSIGVSPRSHSQKPIRIGDLSIDLLEVLHKRHPGKNHTPINHIFAIAFKAANGEEMYKEERLKLRLREDSRVIKDESSEADYEGREGEEKEEEEEAAPGEVQQALEENEKEGAEEGGPAEDQAPAVEEKMEEQSPAVEEQAGMKRKRNEEEDPAAENKEERVDGEEAPPEVERLTLRKRPRKDYRGFSIPPEDSSDSSAASDATLLLACLLWLFVHICVFVCVYVCL
ncbi:cilia- and flagella-associated protein 251-like [Xenopus laevis]|uniref:Cilia- and flagella-associated protein 251-like n=1 Tax=Xenopus laevis TaxID=8355 RepID=A0A8J1LJZ1_XENLA|nr:cilia- and flagella-associated protein 251-like [Xenopus laevis]